jgi:hypothetical protein
MFPSHTKRTLELTPSTSSQQPAAKKQEVSSQFATPAVPFAPPSPPKQSKKSSYWQPYIREALEKQFTISDTAGGLRRVEVEESVIAWLKEVNKM